MLEFEPWSRKTLDHAGRRFVEEGYFTILDIELGGGCNCRCVYCDSPDRSKRFTSEQTIQALLESGSFDWLFICGLGEPTYEENEDSLQRLLQTCKGCGIRCSMFTNLTNVEEWVFDFVENGTLFPMFKLDSMLPKRISEIYRCSITEAEQSLDNVRTIAGLVRTDGGCTNVCASIVPTTMNDDSLEEVFGFCHERNIFPLVGDLEYSGFGIHEYERLRLSTSRLQSLKDSLGDDYRVPICPSVLYGIHVLHDGRLAVDEKTGLSCHWFWLTEPEIEVLGDVESFDSIMSITDAIKAYRGQRLEYVRNVAENPPRLIFGGCGGDVRFLLNYYLANVQGY